jgi:hypothetical protein
MMMLVSLSESWLREFFRANSRSALKYMTVPAMIAEANNTPITTVDNSLQLVRLRRATRGQALVNLGIIPSIFSVRQSDFSRHIMAAS